MIQRAIGYFTGCPPLFRFPYKIKGCRIREKFVTFVPYNPNRHSEMSPYQGTIRQNATVIRVTDAEIEVEVCRPEACAACKAKSVCSEGGSTGEGGGRKMTLINDGQGYVVGEQVMLVMRRSSGFKAVVIAYLVPVFVVVGTLLALQAAGVRDTVAALLTLGVLCLYFLVIRLLRGKINRGLTIEIEKEIEA